MSTSSESLTFHEQQMLKGGFQFPKSRKRRKNWQKNKSKSSCSGQPVSNITATSSASLSSRVESFDMSHFRKKVLQYTEQIRREAQQLMDEVFHDALWRQILGRHSGMEHNESCDKHVTRRYSLEEQQDSTQLTEKSSRREDNSLSLLPKRAFIYGIGDLQSQASLFQFACLLTILASPSCSQLQDIYFYEPMLELSLDMASLKETKEMLHKEYNIQCLEENDECHREMNEPSLVYMPHCPRALYVNLLSTNWGSRLHNMILIGNNLPLPASVVQKEWDFTGIFSPCMSVHDLSLHGLNDTSVYLLKAGGQKEELTEFIEQYLPDQKTARTYYVTRDVLK